MFNIKKKNVIDMMYNLQKDIIRGKKYSYEELEDIYKFYEDEFHKEEFSTIKIKKLHPNAKMPTYGTKQATGLDLYAVIDNGKNFNGQTKLVTYILPNETKVINTGIAMEIPNNCFGGIYPRSGLAIKKGLNLANSVAVIDSDYRGEIKVALYNQSNTTQRIENGDRIAQLVIQPYIKTQLEETDDLTDTDRGNGGFGSTGIK